MNHNADMAHLPSAACTAEGLAAYQRRGCAVTSSTAQAERFVAYVLAHGATASVQTTWAGPGATYWYVIRTEADIAAARAADW